MLTLYKDEQQTTIRENIETFLTSMLERDNYHTWVVLEIARDEEIKLFLSLHEENLHYLFNDDDEALQDVGAVAFCLRDIPEALEWIVTHWGKNWFSFFLTEYEVEEVVEHMSSLCYLSSHGKRYLFRYYDPVTFSCWVSALGEVERVDKALGFFSEVYVETPLPHMLMQYAFDDNTYKQYAIDLQENLKGLSLPLAREEGQHSSLDGCWYMNQKEYEYLAPVSLNAFKIKLCKNLLQEYDLLDTYTLTEVYNIISTEVARAIKYGIEQKHLLAHFVNIYFEYPEFWKKNQNMIQETIEKIKMDEVDRMEIILKAVSEFDEESKI